ncbi:hypothetical protein ACFSTI_27620 [Rhizorhabdus histidinilytica]
MGVLLALLLGVAAAFFVLAMPIRMLETVTTFTRLSKLMVQAEPPISPNDRTLLSVLAAILTAGIGWVLVDWLVFGRAGMSTLIRTRDDDYEDEDEDHFRPTDPLDLVTPAEDPAAEWPVPSTGDARRPLSARTDIGDPPPALDPFGAPLAGLNQALPPISEILPGTGVSAPPLQPNALPPLIQPAAFPQAAPFPEAEPAPPEMPPPPAACRPGCPRPACARMVRPPIRCPPPSTKSRPSRGRNRKSIGACSRCGRAAVPDRDAGRSAAGSSAADAAGGALRPAATGRRDASVGRATFRRSSARRRRPATGPTASGGTGTGTGPAGSTAAPAARAGFRPGPARRIIGSSRTGIATAQGRCRRTGAGGTVAAGPAASTGACAHSHAHAGCRAAVPDGAAGSASDHRTRAPDEPVRAACRRPHRSCRSLRRGPFPNCAATNCSTSRCT